MQRRIALMILAAIVAGGCTAFTPPNQLPVIERNLGKAGTLSVRAERRNAYVDKDSGHFCAEPSPDVSESFTNMMKLAVEAGAAKGAFSGNATIDFQHAFANSVSPLLIRSQGVQLFRDGAFGLCQMHHNGASEKDYELFRFLVEKSSVLIQAELAYIVEARKQLARANVAPAISMTGSNSTITINGPVRPAAPAAGDAPAKPDPKTPDNAAAQPDPKAAGQQAAAKADEKAKKEKAKDKSP